MFPVSNREEILKAFGEHIKKIRTDKKMTQLEVSSAMQRDQQSLQRIEKGKVNPSLTYLIDLAGALGVEPSELLGFLREK